ncbi:hypothetical protein VNO77_34368 [Canavalia gladiata]|uniref:Uncharacterized protein n=1 Tax=Canavalia gladiata TaxID=3824 RepID=A0AAN9KG19_CANGL
MACSKELMGIDGDLSSNAEKASLQNKAFYFESVGVLGEKRAMRLDLTYDGLRVEKAKVGPLGSALFDSAVSISSDSDEVITLHKFIREYVPDDSDELLFNVYGAHKGKDRATTSAINGITRLQILQYLRKLLDDPTKLVQFSYLHNAPHGDVVLQTLAVNYRGGPLVTGFVNTRNQPETQSSDEITMQNYAQGPLREEFPCNYDDPNRRLTGLYVLDEEDRAHP